MIKQEVIKVGNALEVVLSMPPTKRSYGIKSDDSNPSIGPDGLNLPAPSDDDIAAFIKAGERCIEQYRGGLRTLAKR